MCYNTHSEPAMPNDYSQTWFDLFLRRIDPAQTQREIAFLQRQLPLPRYERVLDVCCGMGRHTRLLAERGYSVVGLDQDARAVEIAWAEAPSGAQYVQGDMRKLDEVPGSYDAALIMWQSFGNFDEATNQDILHQIHRKLNSGGRLVLDIYNRDFFEPRQGARSREEDGRTVAETKWMEGNRLTVHLDYGRGTDTFNWQVFTPDEIVALAAKVGFSYVLACANFDEATPPSAEIPRMQLVFEKASA
jgi:SAM-dependent methyltransferase